MLIGTRARANGGGSLWSSTGIADRAMDHQPVPDEQHDQRPNRGGDKARALVGPIPADSLAEERGDERAADSEQRSEDEALRIVRPRRQETRDDAGDETDQNDPEDARHDALPVVLGSVTDSTAGCPMRRSLSNNRMGAGSFPCRENLRSIFALC